MTDKPHWTEREEALLAVATSFKGTASARAIVSLLAEALGVNRDHLMDRYEKLFAKEMYEGMCRLEDRSPTTAAIISEVLAACDGAGQEEQEED